MKLHIPTHREAARALWSANLDRLPVELVREVMRVFEGSVVEELVIADETDRVETDRERRW